MSKCQKYVKTLKICQNVKDVDLSKRCQISKRQTTVLEGKFTLKDNMTQ